MRSSTPFEHSGSRDGAVGGGVGIGVVHTTQIQSLHDTPVKQERFMCNLLKHCYIHKAGARRGACFVFTSVHFCQLVWASLPASADKALSFFPFSPTAIAPARRRALTLTGDACNLLY